VAIACSSASLRRALNVAVRWQLIHINPASLVEPPSLPHVEVRPYSLDEARRFLKAVECLRLEAGWLIGIALGLRQGDVLGLRWDDVDLAAGTLRVRGQLQRDPETGQLAFVETRTARSRRTLPVPPTVLAALRRHQKRQAAERLDADSWADSGLVFAARVGTPFIPATTTARSVKSSGRPVSGRFV
jgi:integrase